MELCSYKGCASIENSKKNKFFSFPPSTDYRFKIWLKHAGIDYDGFSEDVDHKICLKHFPDKYLKFDNGEYVENFRKIMIPIAKPNVCYCTYNTLDETCAKLMGAKGKILFLEFDKSIRQIIRVNKNSGDSDNSTNNREENKDVLSIFKPNKQEKDYSKNKIHETLNYSRKVLGAYAECQPENDCDAFGMHLAECLKSTNIEQKQLAINLIDEVLKSRQEKDITDFYSIKK